MRQPIDGRGSLGADAAGAFSLAPRVPPRPPGWRRALLAPCCAERPPAMCDTVTRLLPAACPCISLMLNSLNC